MKRVTLCVCVVVLFVGVLLSGRPSHVGAVADGTPGAGAEATITALQTQSATYKDRLKKASARVSELKTQVAALQAQIPAPAPTDVPGTVSLSGSGQTAVDPFELPGGLYKFAATCDLGFFFVDFKPVAGNEFVSLPLAGEGPFRGSTNASIKGGRYAISIQCQGLWTLDISPVV
ncbi:MAG: hypothetical protein ACR2OO_12100 [Thermomicrobiales bacterium]